MFGPFRGPSSESGHGRSCKNLPVCHLAKFGCYMSYRVDVGWGPKNVETLGPWLRSVASPMEINPSPLELPYAEFGRSTSNVFFALLCEATKSSKLLQ